MPSWLLKLNRLFRYYAISLFRLNGGSERVARGFTIGALVNFFPTFGFGVVISGFLAGLFRGNVIAGVVGGGLFAFLWPLLFFLNMQVGEFFFHSPVPVEELEDVTEKNIDALVLGKTFLWGATVNCFIFGLLLYGIVYFTHSRSRQNVLKWLKRIKTKRANRKTRMLNAKQTQLPKAD